MLINIFADVQIEYAFLITVVLEYLDLTTVKKFMYIKLAFVQTSWSIAYVAHTGFTISLNVYYQV